MNHAPDREAADDDDAPPEVPEAIELELRDELDLHTFAPREVAELVADYVEACAERGFERVRIVHGKGRGTLRRTVHAVLERHPQVVRYELAGAGAGSWGATFAWLRAGSP